MKDLLKSDKLIKFAFISGIVAIALIFLSDFGKSTETAVTDEQALEQRITEMLTAMDGIDEVPNVTVRLDEDKRSLSSGDKQQDGRKGNQCGKNGS